MQPGPVAFRLPARCGRTPHISHAHSRAIHSWTLNIISSSSFLAADDLPCLRQSTAGFERFSAFFVVITPEPSARGNLDTTSVYFTFLGGCWTNFFLFLRAGVDSDPVVDSRLALRGCSMEKCAQLMLRFHGFSSSWHLESGHYFISPLYQTDTWSLFQDCVMRKGIIRFFFSSIFRTLPSGVGSQVVVPIDAPSEWTYTRC